MKSSKSKCQECRECCKFEKDEMYFAPLFTKQEIEKIKHQARKGINLKFHAYKGSKKVFQVELVKSIEDSKLWVCPLLDEKSHLCRIYSSHNLDCMLWPFIFMHGKKSEVVLAHFDRDMCPIWNEMKDEEFALLKKKMQRIVKDEKIIDTLRKHPELIWEPEKYTNVISTHKLERKKKQTF